MSGYEPRISSSRSDRSTNCVTTAGKQNGLFMKSMAFFIEKMNVQLI